MAGRTLLWVDKVYFRGWACSHCTWRMHSTLSREAPAPEVSLHFDAHACDRFAGRASGSAPADAVACPASQRSRS